ncbi:MAG: 50S ribosomal protein L10 [Planctomycetota bacterium]|nr:50S ribosomal protein L10 [Planctomycetota bacterium]
MSKPVKTLLRKDLIGRLEGVRSLAVLSLAGVDGVATERLRRQLRSGGVSVSVVKNSIARYALEQVGLSSACGLIDGPCALAWGGEGVVTVVRGLFEANKDIPALLVKGAMLEGEVFGADRIEELSRYPTREEALGTVVMLVKTAGARLAGCLLGPGGRLAGAIKGIEKQDEN